MASHKLMSFLTTLLVVGLLASLSQATVPYHPNRKLPGTAAFTSSPNSDSSCFGRDFRGTMFTGVNDALYKNGTACGLQYKVSCLGGIKGQPNPCWRRHKKTITVTVADSCTPEPDTPGGEPEPCPTFVLSKPAFQLIANLTAGVVRVSYKLFNP